MRGREFLLRAILTPGDDAEAKKPTEERVAGWPELPVNRPSEFKYGDWPAKRTDELWQDARRIDKVSFKCFRVLSVFMKLITDFSKAGWLAL